MTTPYRHSLLVVDGLFQHAHLLVRARLDVDATTHHGSHEKANLFRVAMVLFPLLPIHKGHAVQMGGGRIPLPDAGNALDNLENIVDYTFSVGLDTIVLRTFRHGFVCWSSCECDDIHLLTPCCMQMTPRT